MSVLDRLASSLGRNDEVPNQELAREIAASGDTNAVQELVANLANRDKAIQSDCIKVLYEIGSLRPDLIAPYAVDFVALLQSRNNRLVWGGMTALGAVASLSADRLWPHVDVIVSATEHGSAITQDWGVRVLAAISAHDPAYGTRILPYLRQFLQTCPPKDLPRHAESVLPAVTAANRADVLSVLQARQPTLLPAQAKRLAQTIRKINAIS